MYVCRPFKSIIYSINIELFAENTKPADYENRVYLLIFMYVCTQGLNFSFHHNGCVTQYVIELYYVSRYVCVYVCI